MLIFTVMINCLVVVLSHSQETPRLLTSCVTALTAASFLSICIATRSDKGVRQNNQTENITFSSLNENELKTLPKIDINSNLFFKQVNISFWKIFIDQETIFSKSTAELDDEIELCEIKVSAKFPLFAFYERSFFNNVTNPEFQNRRLARDINDKSSFLFEIRTLIPLSYITSKNRFLEFRSNEYPYVGISIFQSYNSEDRSIVILSSSEVSAENVEYFNSLRADVEDSLCDGHIFVEQFNKISSVISERQYACGFRDGSQGTLRLFIAQERNICEINRELHNARKSCWKWCRNNPVCQRQLRPYDLQYQWTTQLPMCDPLSLNREIQKTFYSTPIIFGLPKGESRTPAIYLNYDDIREDTMIEMTPFELFQDYNSTIEITCTISRYYCSLPFQLAAQTKYGAGKMDLEFFDDLHGEQSTEHHSRSVSYKILLHSTAWERIFCFAPVLGSYNWINTSKPIHVFDPSQPTFLVNKETSLLILQQLDTNTFKTQKHLRIGATDGSITCNATGHPLPEINWTQNGEGLEEYHTEAKPHQFKWSRILLPTPIKVESKEYTCIASNSQGVSLLIFNVIVTDETGGTSFNVVILSISIVGSILFFLAVALVCWEVKYRDGRRRQLSLFLTDEEYREFFHGSPRAHIITTNSHQDQAACTKFLPLHKKYIIPRIRLTYDMKEVLGSGNYGLVLKGWLTKDDDNVSSPVAVKTLKPNIDGLDTIPHFKALLSEIKVNAYLDTHPNIVQFLGVVIEDIRKGKIYVAVEFCPNGDLRACLQKRKALYKLTDQCKIESHSKSENAGAQISDTLIMDLYGWSRDIACGMSFLRLKSVIHGDLATRNVLLTVDNVAKIADFGLSRQLLNDYSVYEKKSKVPLPWKWMALESLTSSIFSVHSDMWSFGVTLWEIFSLGDAPYSGLRYDANFIREITSGYRLPKPLLANTKIYGIMQRCWEKNPECRPGISNIFAEISAAILSIKSFK